jgi:putative photosynthetic complex assembly protein 2
MGGVILASVYALFVWWFSTGVVLMFVLRRGAFVAAGLVGAALLCPASLYALARSGTDSSVAGAYVAFTAAILLWGTQELAFLAGALTGPRPRPCPADARGARRAAYAIAAILYHEISLILAGVATMVATWGAPNQVGALTFLILWVMRLSAKLNLFLGVPVLNDEIMPDHLTFLRSYFRRGPVNALFPLVMVVSVLATGALVDAVLAPGAGAATQVGSTLLAALLALAILEHGFMVVPLPVDALWRWSQVARARSVSGGVSGAAEGHRRERPCDLGDIKRVLPTIP